jgi:hypothetical protein
MTQDEYSELEWLKENYKLKREEAKKLGVELNRLIAEENNAKQAFLCYQGYLVATKQMQVKDVTSGEE